MCRSVSAQRMNLSACDSKNIPKHYHSMLQVTVITGFIVLFARCKHSCASGIEMVQSHMPYSSGMTKTFVVTFHCSLLLHECSVNQVLMYLCYSMSLYDIMLTHDGHVYQWLMCTSYFHHTLGPFSE